MNLDILIEYMRFKGYKESTIKQTKNYARRIIEYGFEDEDDIRDELWDKTKHVRREFARAFRLLKEAERWWNNEVKKRNN